MSTEPNIKHRVTGALVLIALAVIFLPLILDGQKKNQILNSRIPDKPIQGEIIQFNKEEKSEKIQDSKKEKSITIDLSKIQANQQNGSEEVKQTIEKVTNSEPKISTEAVKSETKEIADKQKAETVKEVVVARKLSEQTTEETERNNRPNYQKSAFVIQLGSFSNETNAKKIVEKLKAAGFKAYLKKGSSNGKTINRVLVGPELDKDKAESKITKLNELSGLKAIIVGYDPVRH